MELAVDDESFPDVFAELFSIASLGEGYGCAVTFLRLEPPLEGAGKEARIVARVRLPPAAVRELTAMLRQFESPGAASTENASEASPQES